LGEILGYSLVLSIQSGEIMIRVPMETSEAAAAHPQKDSVKVAVNIRPLITVELQDGCTDCVTVTPGEPQVPIW
jgi:hypothetical protein